MQTLQPSLQADRSSQALFNQPHGYYVTTQAATRQAIYKIAGESLFIASMIIYS